MSVWCRSGFLNLGSVVILDEINFHDEQLPCVLQDIYQNP